MFKQTRLKVNLFHTGNKDLSISVGYPIFPKEIEENKKAIMDLLK